MSVFNYLNLTSMLKTTNKMKSHTILFEELIWSYHDSVLMIGSSKVDFIIYGIHIFMYIDWLEVYHVIKNKLTILKKLGQSRK